MSSQEPQKGWNGEKGPTQSRPTCCENCMRSDYRCALERASVPGPSGCFVHKPGVNVVAPASKTRLCLPDWRRGTPRNRSVPLYNARASNRSCSRSVKRPHASPRRDKRIPLRLLPDRASSGRVRRSFQVLPWLLVGASRKHNRQPLLARDRNQQRNPLVDRAPGG